MRRSRSRSLIVVLLVFVGLGTSPFVFSTGNQKIAPTDSILYREISTLYVSVGMGLPSSSGPWSFSELRIMMDSIDQEKLSSKAKILYQKILGELAKEEQVFTGENSLWFGGNITLSPEIYIHTNEESTFGEDEEWAYSYALRNPILSVPLMIGFEDAVYGETLMEIRNNRFYPGTDSSSQFFSPVFTTNIIFDDSLSNLDTSFPWRAYVSTGGELWNVQFGRDKLAWGNGVTGNLMLDDHLDFHEFLRISAWDNDYKFSFLTAAFDPENWKKDDDGAEAQESIQYFIAHRLEFPVFSLFQLSITESMMYKADQFDFRYLNPLMLFHNYYMRDNSNSLISIQIDIPLFSGAALYGEFAADEIAGFAEASGGEGAFPEAYGYLAGITLRLPVGAGWLNTNFEFAYTDPYLYLRDHVNFIVGHRQHTNEYETFSYNRDWDYLGYQYGCDAIVLDLSVRYEDFTRHLFVGEVFYMMHGTHDLDTTWDNVTDGSGNIPSQAVTPTTVNYSGEDPEKNSIEHTLRFSLSVEEQMFSIMDVSGGVDFITIWNPGNIAASIPAVDWQLHFGVSYSL
ncbi:MAG: hypothetical protein HQ557_00765 [Bacteroidetes bacterium]|nr:hypothetical protein [Bacteroidota bacterium]